MQQPSQWGLLFDAAVATIRHTEATVGGRFVWSFGGGTALMLQIDHRESHDVDLFIDDPQILPLLNPLTQGYSTSTQPNDYDTDGTRMIKLIRTAYSQSLLIDVILSCFDTAASG